MRLRVCLTALLLTACTGASVLGDEAVSSSSAPSLPPSSSSSRNPKAPTVHLRWIDKKLPPIIKGQPRRRLSLQLSGAHRELVYVGTFNGEAFDLQGTFVGAETALLKASIGWKGAGSEIWVERKDASTLVVRHRDINEEKPYLTVDRIVATVDIEEGLQVTGTR